MRGGEDDPLIQDGAGIVEEVEVFVKWFEFLIEFVGVFLSFANDAEGLVF